MDSVPSAKSVKLWSANTHSESDAVYHDLQENVNDALSLLSPTKQYIGCIWWFVVKSTYVFLSQSHSRIHLKFDTVGEIVQKLK